MNCKPFTIRRFGKSASIRRGRTCLRPAPNCSLFVSPTKTQAVAEAQRRVDALISK